MKNPINEDKICPFCGNIMKSGSVQIAPDENTISWWCENSNCHSIMLAINSSHEIAKIEYKILAKGEKSK